MSQLAQFSHSAQTKIIKAAYECLNRIDESAKKLLETFPKKLSYQLACHSFIQEILIEFFLPNETMKDKDYEDVHWDDAFKMIEKAAPFKASICDYIINKTIREEMYTLMIENEQFHEAELAKREGKKQEEEAKKLGFDEIQDVDNEEYSEDDDCDGWEDSESSEDDIDEPDYEVINKYEMKEDNDCSFEIIEESDC